MLCPGRFSSECFQTSWWEVSESWWTRLNNKFRLVLLHSRIMFKRILLFREICQPSISVWHSKVSKIETKYFEKKFAFKDNSTFSEENVKNLKWKFDIGGRDWVRCQLLSQGRYCVDECKDNYDWFLLHSHHSCRSIYCCVSTRLL